MNFEKKYLTRASFLAASLFLAGCVMPPEPPAPEPAVVSSAEQNPVAVAALSVPAVKEKIVVSEPTTLSEEAVGSELNFLLEETGKLQLEKNLIEARLGLLAAENERTQAPLRLEKMRLDADRAERAAKLAAEIAGIEEERAELEGRLALETARAAAAIREKQLRVQELELEARELQAEVNKEQLRTQYAVALLDKRTQLSMLAPAAAQTPKYLKEPFIDGTLYVSDRRIPLNGPITAESAKTVCDQIYFYNNQNSNYPIFIVIDSSPGGSVAAGYQIQKAMESSQAPVYVVVKNFAASMAAVITTTAERSFCFENTIILQHQISSEVKGNLTVMREGVTEGAQWYDRFAGPVAKKMGLSLSEFTRQMYAHNSDGDWQELGPRAVELKWVDQLVNRIEETGVVAIADDPASKKQPNAQTYGALEEKTDARGKRFVELPALRNPFDFWAIYDKDDYYRTR